MHNAISSTASVATLIEEEPLSAFECKPGGNVKVFPKWRIKKNTCKSHSTPGNS